MESAKPRLRPGSALEIFATFLWLGATAFGGPASHIGYFQEALVRRRRWLDETAFAELVALCQFLPGPASSQTAFAIGVQRSGRLSGGFAAWLAFSLPACAIMVAFAYGVGALQGPLAAGALAGLKLVAAAIVAQAVLAMARSLTPDAARIAIAVAAGATLLAAPGALVQVAVIAGGAILGLLLRRKAWLTAPAVPLAAVSRRMGLFALAVFAAILFALPALRLALDNPVLAMGEAFYRSGALVFGGGHVVLPLLHEAVVSPGWIGEEAFLAGYGAAQAVPGPLFSFAAYLGAAMPGHPSGIAGAALAFGALSLPGLLAVIGALPFWSALRARPAARAALSGANAAVVGVLAAALYHPIGTSAVRDWIDGLAALGGFVLLVGLRAPPLVVVGLGVAFGMLRATLG